MNSELRVSASYQEIKGSLSIWNVLCVDYNHGVVSLWEDRLVQHLHFTGEEMKGQKSPWIRLRRQRQWGLEPGLEILEILPQEFQTKVGLTTPHVLTRLGFTTLCVV